MSSVRFCIGAFRRALIEKPKCQQEISNLQHHQREDGPNERFADRSGFHFGPDRHYGRRGEHPHQKLRKIHDCPPPVVDSPPLHLRSGGAPHLPPDCWVRDVAGIADSAMTVPDTVTH